MRTGLGKAEPHLSQLYGVSMRGFTLWVFQSMLDSPE
jgi:hypothetical protein